LSGIDSIHLLQGSKVARRKILALYSIVSVNDDCFVFDINSIRLQLPLATDAKKHNTEQYAVDFFHYKQRINVKIRCKNTKKYFKNQILT